MEARRRTNQTMLEQTQSQSQPASTPLLAQPRLHYFHELDEWQQDNHYILSGYVKETRSFRRTLASLGYLHNETVNIYTHLFPGLVWLLAVLYYVDHKLPQFSTSLGWERLNFLQFALAITVCFGASASFHTIKSHSLRVCKQGNQLDYFGIIILITCSLVSIVLFAFHDVPGWRNVCIAVFVGLGAICTTLTLDSRFATPQYRPLRSLMFVIFGLSGLLPVIVAIRKFGFETAVARSNAHWLIAEGAFYIGGAVLYAMRVPERFGIQYDRSASGPVGVFDIWGNSHQIFHVMVVVAAYCHWRALVGCYLYLHEHILA
ncbi:Uncharacterized protein ABC855_g2007 [[Candida] zeylanoides]